MRNGVNERKFLNKACDENEIKSQLAPQALPRYPLTPRSTLPGLRGLESLLGSQQHEQFPLAPVGALAPGSAHARPSDQPPIDTSGKFSVQVSVYCVYSVAQFCPHWAKRSTWLFNVNLPPSSQIHVPAAHSFCWYQELHLQSG